MPSPLRAIPAVLTAISVGLLMVAVFPGTLLPSQPEIAGQDRGRGPGDPRSREHLLSLYDLSNPQVELANILSGGVTKDGIPALTDPKRIGAASATFPSLHGRVAEVVINDEAVAYPLGILNHHEIANDTVGGVPIAVIYCPLCDSVSILDRRLTVEGEDGTSTEIVLEFGVSGLLYNSNVVMYERGTMGLWSQVYMKAITGPHAGRGLKHLPVRVREFRDFKREHRGGKVLSVNTGYRRNYRSNPYQRYLAGDQVFHRFRFGSELPPKTLGMGIKVGGFTAFVPRAAAKNGAVTVETPDGPVVVSANPAGLAVDKAPESAETVQTFYHSWSAFHPDTKIVRDQPTD